MVLNDIASLNVCFANMKILVALLSTFLFSVTLLKDKLDAQTVPGPVRERLSLDKGWRFFQGDIPFPEINGHGMTYQNAKAGKSWGAAAPDFDDSEWRLLDLPHDWSVESGFDKANNPSQGYRTRGIGWYRRKFKLDVSEKGNHFEIQFDGAATNCTVWVNGTLMHRNWCGYTSFYIDVTPMLNYGDELNNIVVRVDALPQEGWWYEGAGIYRHTWLVKRSAIHIETDGVFANPVKKGNDDWSIPTEVSVFNSGKTGKSFELRLALLDESGNKIADAANKGNVASLDNVNLKTEMTVARPRLWELSNPVLYKLVSKLYVDEQLTDSAATMCGFRSIRFSADSGFFLNEKSVKIKGTCNHLDHAGVGVAVPDAIWEFRIKKLKEMGSNAYRCSHNPPANEFLDACDRNGILVMDENRNFNVSPDYRRQLEWMVRRDRNHPSIILWSVFNEEPMQGTENGYEMVRRMSAWVKKLDVTRPVTAAASGGLFTPINVSHAVDVVGFNYQQGGYENFHKQHPEKAITSSEDVSGLMNRGEYVNNKSKNLLAAYDENKPGWGETHRKAWKAIATKPYVAGCFVWTGFDYRGEPQPFTWPSAGSSFGIMDQCGFPKTAFFIHQAQWSAPEKNILHFVPHWTWPKDSIGKTIKVMVMSNAETVKLLLNGKTIGEQAVDSFEMNSFNVPYAPGKLEAVAYKKGKEVARFVQETTSKPLSLRLTPDRNVLKGDGQDAMPITVEVLDDKGRHIDTSNNRVVFQAEGPAGIIGLGNGDHNCHEPEKGNAHSLYNGFGQLIVRSLEGGKGTVTITAKADGLKPASVTLNVEAAAALPSVAVASPLIFIEKWRQSPFANAKPDPNQEIPDFDMNTWAPVKPGSTQKFSGGVYAIYRAHFKPFAQQAKEGGKLRLKDVVGKAEVWIDKVLVAKKETTDKADIACEFAPKQGNRVVSVLIEAAAEGNSAGLGGTVSVTSK